MKKSEMLPFPSDFFRASDGKCFFSEQAMEIAVFLPMVLQIRKTMVLQRIELGGKGILSHFCLFGLSVAWMRKHGFAEKLH